MPLPEMKEKVDEYIKLLEENSTSLSENNCDALNNGQKQINHIIQ